MVDYGRPAAGVRRAVDGGWCMAGEVGRAAAGGWRGLRGEAGSGWRMVDDERDEAGVGW